VHWSANKIVNVCRIHILNLSNVGEDTRTVSLYNAFMSEQQQQQNHNNNNNNNKFSPAQVVNGKAIPLQVWTGPGVSMRLRVPDFKTIGT